MCAARVFFSMVLGCFGGASQPDDMWIPGWIPNLGGSQDRFPHTLSKLLYILECRWQHDPQIGSMKKPLHSGESLFHQESVCLLQTSKKRVTPRKKDACHSQKVGFRVGSEWCGAVLRVQSTGTHGRRASFSRPRHWEARASHAWLGNGRLALVYMRLAIEAMAAQHPTWGSTKHQTN